jgi:hypothetical protein
VLVINIMGEVAASTEASLKEIRSAVDLFHGRLTVIDTAHQSLVAQMGLISDAIKDSTEKHTETARVLVLLDARLHVMMQAMERTWEPLRAEDDPDPVTDGGAIVGKGTMHPAQVS